MDLGIQPIVDRFYYTNNYMDCSKEKELDLKGGGYHGKRLHSVRRDDK